MILQPKVITDNYSVCSVLNIHLKAIKQSQQKVIQDMTQKINKFFEAEFYKPLKKLEKQIVKQNNNQATS